MADMIKFYKGAVASLPTTGVNGALYITTDEGAIYLGTGTGMKRLGDFVQVDNVASLPEKAHESCLYYCVAENILAKWNGSEWKQINKQPTAEEMKTLLGLGSLAYLSEVAEDNLATALKEKVNAAAEGNHSHANKGVLDGITAEKVAAWDASEGNAKGYADGLNTAMNTRVEALEAIDHEHSNKALLDTYTQTEENLADAVAKKHEHSNKTELDKIVAGDVAKWNGVVADHLTSSDKTALEDAIADVNTAVENEAKAARAAEKANADAITGIKNGTSVNDFAAAEAEIAKKVDKVEGKSLILDTEITRLSGMSDGANKVETSETNGNIKIDGVETVVYTHPDKHSISDVTGLQDALDGMQAKGDYAVEGHKHTKADITDFTHTHTASEITDLDSTIKGYDYATKTELGDVDAKFADYVTSESYGTDKAGIDAAIADRYTKSEADGKFALIADAYDDTELAGRVKAIEDDYLVEADKTELSGLMTAEKERAEGIEGGLRTDVDAIKGDYLKGSDKTELSGLITAEESRAKGVEEGLQNQINLIMNNPDTEGVINSIEEFTNYINTHGEIAEGFRTDIDKNKEDIATINNADTGILKQAKDYADGLADNYAAADHDHVVADITDFDSAVATKIESYGYATTGYADQAEADAKSYADTEIAKDRARLDVLEAIDHDAYVGADTALKAELQKEIDDDVKALADTVYTKTEVEALLTWGSF